MTKARLEKAKEYAMSRTYPRFDSIFISNFVHREIEGTYLEGSKETENLEHQIKNVQRALNKWVDKAKENKKEVIKLLAQIEKMKRHCNCKHRDSEGYCEVKRIYLIDLSYDGCDKWELED